MLAWSEHGRWHQWVPAGARCQAGDRSSRSLSCSRVPRQRRSGHLPGHQEKAGCPREPWTHPCRRPSRAPCLLRGRLCPAGAASLAGPPAAGSALAPRPVPLCPPPFLQTPRCPPAAGSQHGAPAACLLQSPLSPYATSPRGRLTTMSLEASPPHAVQPTRRPGHVCLQNGPAVPARPHVHVHPPSGCPAPPTWAPLTDWTLPQTISCP